MTDTAARPFHYGKDVFLYPLLIFLVFFFIGEYAVYGLILDLYENNTRKDRL